MHAGNDTEGDPRVRLALDLAASDPDLLDATLERLAREDPLGQLLERRGRMRALGSEAGEPKLDWVDGLDAALGHPERLDACEREARALLARGTRHVIWAGMGGSVQTVYVLARMGLLDGPDLSIHPLDSTDPASLNRILRAIARAEGIAPGDDHLIAALPEILARTAMVGVSMGMTSEEPITHLEWFDGLLAAHGVDDRATHIEVMTLPGSYLDRFAAERGCARTPIQLDGRSGTPGRMSAPATRVFLRPAALRLAAGLPGLGAAAPPAGARLAALLETARTVYGLDSRLDGRARQVLVRTSPFTRLAACLALRSRAGRNQVALAPDAAWRGIEPWIEQLAEESLGKGGKGFLVFHGAQPWRSLRTSPLLLGIGAPREPADGARIELPPATDPSARMGLVAGLFAGLELTAAVYGYLEGIVFAGQPAVEAYKAYARAHRAAAGGVDFGPAGGLPRTGCVALDAGALERRALLDLAGVVRDLGGPADAGLLLGEILARAHAAGAVRYLDFTFNGEVSELLRQVLERARAELAHAVFGIPAKIRTGPSDYHSTEQSEVDGPPELASIRIVARRHEAVLAGDYPDTLLLAQARGTWQAMEDAGRWVVLLTIPELGPEALRDLEALFERAARHARARTAGPGGSAASVPAPV